MIAEVVWDDKVVYSSFVYVLWFEDYGLAPSSTVSLRGKENGVIDQEPKLSQTNLLTFKLLYHIFDTVLTIIPSTVFGKFHNKLFLKE